MRKILLALPILLGACSALPAATQQELACTGQTFRQAFQGDFHDWVLPDFVPGTHLKAGQFSSCMPPQG